MDDRSAGRTASRTASAQREGLPVVDPHGGRWRVRWHRAAAAGPPDPSASPAALRSLLDPRRSRTIPRTGPPPAASWVMGRSARWQGPNAPTTEEPSLEDATRFRYALASTSTLPSLFDLVQLAATARRIPEAVRTIRREPTRPWVVEPVASDDHRSVLWHAPRPEAAQQAAHQVRAALDAGALPTPVGAVLMELRNPRPPGVSSPSCAPASWVRSPR